MGRPIKRGLEYFPFDVDFFSDLKVRKLIKYQGGKAVTVYALLLCIIYKQGYYMRWDDELPFIVSEQTGFEEAYILEVIKCCMVVGLFSKELFDLNKIITSKGIQARYKVICDTSRRVCNITEFCLISSEEITVSSEENTVSSEETIVYPEENPINSVKSTQSKGKVNRKKKKPKETSTNVEAKKAEQAKKLAAAKAATLKRRDSFYQSLVPYVERYGKEMIRAFFDYWSELNKSETKMKFETNQTWEVAKRLATWAKNEKFDRKDNNIPKYGSGSSSISSGNKVASREVVGKFARAVLEQYKSEDSD